MDPLIRFFQQQGGQGDSIAYVEMMLALGLCLAAVLPTCLVYRLTHKGANYSQSYVHSLVIMGLTTTLIMLVIGSNIARAFSLVGALSIIRFRNAVKETRDVSTIYFVMAIAMACGTRFYGLAVIATVLINLIQIVLFVFNFASNKTRPDRLLTVQLHPGLDPEATLTPKLDELFRTWSIVSMETVRQGMYSEVVFSVAPKPGVTGAQVLEAMTTTNDNLKVTYNFSTTTDEL